MSSGTSGHRRFRFDGPHPAIPERGGEPSPFVDQPTQISGRLTAAIERTRDWLLSHQAAEGYWIGELEGDTILESEYVLLLTFLGQGQSERAQACARYILKKQLPSGGWAIYPGGPVDVSASVKAYWVLKIVGHQVDAEYMVRACAAIRAAGGAEQINSFTRYYLALLGAISYEQCPAVPPEIILLPTWCPFNIYEMSAWSRTILIPLSLLWAFRPQRPLPAEQGIRELFLRTPEELPATMGPAAVLDALKHRTWIDWDKLFRRIDWLIKWAERLHLKPLRGVAIRRAAEWMQARFADSDGLGAIFPPIIWSIVALKCLGHSDDSPEVRAALTELDKLSIAEGDSLRLEPCKSPVWDTAIATIALRDAGISADAPTLRRAVEWLLAREVRQLGDWAVRAPRQSPGGWFFEFNNRFYPDVDDTAMVLIALARCLPDGGAWRGEADLFVSDRAQGPDAALVVSQQTTSSEQAVRDVENIRPVLSAIARGARWLTAMQNRDGGWGAFDRDNTREVFTRVPFADHNAMIDPSTADLTARTLEALGGLGMTCEHPIARQAIEFLWREQEPDHCWFGRWGVNYIYGTWQTLLGLVAIGVSAGDARIRRAVAWLKSHQKQCGGWGESPRTYEDPRTRGQGQPTASQTAWALLALCAAGEAHSAAVEAGVQFLLDTQNIDGTWDEAEWTGTGFPKVFYLKYHFYRISFPLMALARVARARQSGLGQVENGEWSLESTE
ncbi:MAG: terpene cyclase/mutase family protein [Planctomycetaceae bacterium]